MMLNDTPVGCSEMQRPASVAGVRNVANPSPRTPRREEKSQGVDDADRRRGPLLDHPVQRLERLLQPPQLPLRLDERAVAVDGGLEGGREAVAREVPEGGDSSGRPLAEEKGTHHDVEQLRVDLDLVLLQILHDPFHPAQISLLPVRQQVKRAPLQQHAPHRRRVQLRPSSPQHPVLRRCHRHRRPCHPPPPQLDPQLVHTWGGPVLAREEEEVGYGEGEVGKAVLHQRHEHARGRLAGELPEGQVGGVVKQLRPLPHALREDLRCCGLELEHAISRLPHGHQPDGRAAVVVDLDRQLHPQLERLRGLQRLQQEGGSNRKVLTTHEGAEEDQVRGPFVHLPVVDLADLLDDVPSPAVWQHRQRRP
eukprot:745829-Hanusia_phi.AAC.1